MTPHALITALEATGLTQAQIGAEVGVTRQTVSNWKHERTPMPQAARMVLAGFLEKRKTMSDIRPYVANAPSLWRRQ